VAAGGSGVVGTEDEGRTGDRYATALAGIDAANAEDPNEVEVAGERGPKELVHALLMTAWVERLDPQADELQLLAARAHHLRRWVVPREEYPDGRAGYLRWRAAQKKRHAAEVGGILEAAGYGPDEVARVGQIIRKEGLGRDPQVQTHEDAVCLVFMQTGFEELTERLGTEKMVDVVAKTLRKMSPAGIAAAAAQPMSAELQTVVARAAALVSSG
jgi:hypothetical protein